MTARGEMMKLAEKSPWLKKVTPDGLLGCNSCPKDWPHPATHLAHPKLKDGSQGDAWPVCSMHVEYAMCAGWFPIDDLSAEDAACLKARALTDEGEGE